MPQIIKCPACSADVSSVAAACPHCGHPIKPPVQRRGGNSGCATLALVFLIGGAILYFFVNTNESPKHTPQEAAAIQKAQEENTLSTEACVDAQMAVKKKLLAPASAEFHCGKVTSNPEHTEFGVVGYVDSQNAFGAMLRKKFVVLLSKAPGAAEMVATKVAVE